MTARRSSESQAAANAAALVTSVDDPHAAELVGPDELARELGISRATIDRARKAGRLPAVREGNAWRFRRTEVLELGEIRQRVPVGAADRARAVGELAARAFPLFRQRVPLDEIVVRLECDPAALSRLFEQWWALRLRTEAWLAQDTPPVPAPGAVAAVERARQAIQKEGNAK